MSGAILRGLLLGGAAAALGVGVLALAAPPFLVHLPAAPPAVAAIGATAVTVSDSLVRQVIARTPFRAARSPAVRPYDLNHGAVEVVEAPQVSRPRLTLAGIVWEPEPVAIIEGLPGGDGGRVVRRGEVVGGLKLKRIERNRVVITGLDTTWNLSVKEPWQ